MANKCGKPELSHGAGIVHSAAVLPVIPDARKSPIEVGPVESRIVQRDRDAHAAERIAGRRASSRGAHAARRKATVGHEQLSFVENEPPDPADAVEAGVDVAPIVSARAPPIDVGAGVVGIAGGDRDAQAPLWIPERRRHRGRASPRRRGGRAYNGAGSPGLEQRSGHADTCRNRGQRPGDQGASRPRQPRPQLPDATSGLGRDDGNGDAHPRREIGWPRLTRGQLLRCHHRQYRAAP
jgi:hypothetical protein